MGISGVSHPPTTFYIATSNNSKPERDEGTGHSWKGLSVVGLGRAIILVMVAVMFLLFIRRAQDLREAAT